MRELHLLWLFFIVLCCSCGKGANYHFVKIENSKHQVLSWGSGEPVVVFLNGGGSELKDFQPVQSEIAKVTRTISYDKPGLGKSELTDTPRTLDNVVKDLKILLEKEKVEESPLILVGHSMGGFVARYYLHLHPKNVLGMVLIDPGSEYLNDEWRKTRTEKQLQQEDSLLSEQIKLIPKGFQMEVMAYPQHDSILKTFRHTTDIPITLLESNKVEKGDDDGKILIEIQKRLYRDFQNLLPQTKIVSTEKSGHFIQLEEPELVVETIKEMLSETKQ